MNHHSSPHPAPMIHLAFSTPVTIQLQRSTPTSAFRPVVFFERPRLRRPIHLPTWRASRSQPDKSANIPDDDILNSELQAKVNELFGGRNNVTIDIERDSGAQFIVRRDLHPTDYEETKAAWIVIISIAVLSVAAGLLFTILYYTGAVHGSNPDESRYEMPSYGSSNYINPYQLLEDDRQLQDARAQ